MKDNEIIDGYWWCGRCQSTKSPFQVTYDEDCTACGSQVEWREDSEPPGGDVVRDLLDEIERLQRALAIESGQDKVRPSDAGDAIERGMAKEIDRQESLIATIRAAAEACGHEDINFDIRVIQILDEAAGAGKIEVE